MPILHIPTKRYWNLTNSLGGVRESTKNGSILSTYLTPVTLTLVRRFWTFRPDDALPKAHIPCEYRDDPTILNGSKGCDRQTDRRTDRQTDVKGYSYICPVADKKVKMTLVTLTLWPWHDKKERNINIYIYTVGGGYAEFFSSSLSICL